MIIHRAFVRETLRACGAVSVILLAIFLLARLMDFLRQATEGDLPAAGGALLLLLKAITYLDILAPLALYVAALLVVGRWSKDNELTVLGACGIGMTQLLKPAMTLVAIVGAVTALLSLYLSPLSAEAARSISQQLTQRADTAGVVPGVFAETLGGHGVYFVESRDETGFGGIFIYDGSGVEDRVVVADSGHRAVHGRGVDGGDVDGQVHGGGGASHDDFLILKNGARYRVSAGAAEYGVLEFETYGLRLKQQPRASRALSLEATPTLRLLNAPTSRAAIGELHWRLSKVAALPVLMIFALAFSATAYRKNRFPGMLSALLIYFAYSNFLGLGVALIRRGAINPHWGLWVIHLLFLGLAIYLLRRRNLNLRLLPGLPA